MGNHSMKINQLFVKPVGSDVVDLIARSFGLTGIGDRRLFSKRDMQANQTVQRLTHIKPILEEYYLPCKARIYLARISEKKAITIFKQLLKLHDCVLVSLERNSMFRKVIFYKISSVKEREMSRQMHLQYDVSVDVTFD